jgi:hypothetical protein
VTAAGGFIGARLRGHRRDGHGLRVALGGTLLAFAIALEFGSLSRGQLTIVPLVLAIGAFAVALGRFGTVVRHLLPALLGLVAYAAARQYVTRYKLPVHYTLQLDFDRFITPGPIPTVWLQEHLYRGHTGPLEVFATVVYVSHFFVPILFGATLLFLGRTRAFSLLVFGILGSALVGELVFVLFPTAPPWLAAQDGYVSGVHHLLKQSFIDLHLTQLASASGNSEVYDTTAAVPSLHVAFPVICLLVARRTRLPRWMTVAFWMNIVAVVFAIVYLGEHYIFDVVAGAFVAITVWAALRSLQEADAVAPRNANG